MTEKYNPKIYWENRGLNYRVAVNTEQELQNLENLIYSFGTFNNNIFCDRLLEVGSGYGRIYEFLQNKKAMPSLFFMCDISQTMADKCQKITGIRPEIWDGKNLPYQDKSFDWVISFSVFLHVLPEQVNKVFCEHLRVCKKYFFIATYSHGLKNLAPHCFQHDYLNLIGNYGLNILDKKYYMIDGVAVRVNYLLEV